MSTECAICYVADRNYLLPTFVSAATLRRFVPAGKAHIYICVIDEDEAYLKELSGYLNPLGVSVLPMDSRCYSGFDITKFNRSYAFVPPASLGRLFIADLLPSSCKRILYLDGDIWIARDPSALIEAVIPEGRFAAVEDMSSFCRYDILPHGFAVRQYYKEIGIKRNQPYFNSGVLASSRNTWKEVCADAYKFFVENTNICRYQDQSALNAVVGDRRLSLSLQWNFPTSFRYWHLEKIIKPHVYHLIQHPGKFPKPWTAGKPVEPWLEIHADYENEIRKFARLHLPRQLFSDKEIDDANARAVRYRRKLNYFFPLRLLLRQQMARNLQRSAYVVH